MKTAASCALGSMAVGSLDDYLPFLLKEISSQPRRQYLLLHSLKEVIRWVFEWYLSISMWPRPKASAALWSIRDLPISLYPQPQTSCKV